MKQIILNVLKDMTKNQVNLGSEASRMVIANSITNALESNGIYRQHTEIELEKQKRPVFPEAKNYCSKKEWVCSICGKNTYDVDWNYIGSNRNRIRKTKKTGLSGSKKLLFKKGVGMFYLW